jgi:site-specific DNA-methyltransferase (adenine-specific)
MENTLYYGDNLDILRRYIPDERVDLVYLDPPFKSNQNCIVLFKEQNRTRAGFPAPCQLVLDRGKDLNEFYNLSKGNP